MNIFDTLCQELIDAWLRSDEATKAEDIYTSIIPRLSVKMALSLVTTAPDDPYDWRFYRLRDFGFKSRQLDRVRHEFPNGALRDLNKGFIDEAIVKAYSRALEIRRPAIDFVRTKVLGIRIGYERLILPQKSAGKSGWCISLIDGRFFTMPAQQAKTDIIDENIIQLLIEGQTAKEIAEFLKLSPRTVEHRIDRLKNRFDARNQVHLVAKLVTYQVIHKENA